MDEHLGCSLCFLCTLLGLRFSQLLSVWPFTDDRVFWLNIRALGLEVGGVCGCPSLQHNMATGGGGYVLDTIKGSLRQMFITKQA